jgi:hypothetical protein
VEERMLVGGSRLGGFWAGWVETLAAGELTLRVRWMGRQIGAAKGSEDERLVVGLRPGEVVVAEFEFLTKCVRVVLSEAA